MSDARVLAILDRSDPFAAPADEPALQAEQLQALAAIPGAEEALVTIAGDAAATAARRYAAAEALGQGPFTAWRTSSEARAAVAGALAAAMPRETTHNRWGLPGHFVGRLGKALLSLADAAEQALVPLLDDDAILSIEGSEAATLQAAARYRVADLAAYLISRGRGLPWPDSAGVAERDQAIAALRAMLRR